ncbi:MAG TPA: hypothetical protein DIU15_00075 [Deltaproteobacteria bacterium]|nr:hypothetical protein [Deltaproteobacteria bacterium]HCP44423.1 hypothetical protein [Deltaproteobacteria bacterium]
MRIALVTVSFPVASEAFIVNEIDALCGEGVSIDVFPMLQRPATDLTGRLQPLLDNQQVRVRTPSSNPGATDKQGAVLAALWLVRHILPTLFYSPLEGIKALVLLSRTLWIHRQIQHESYDLVHCAWGHHPASVGALAKRFTPIPVTLFLGSYDLDRPGPLTRWLYHRADRVLTHAKVNRSLLRSRLGSGAEVSVIYRGVHLPRHPPSHTTSEDLQLVFAGRLTKQKGAMDALETLRIVRARCGDGKLLVAGDGPQARALRDQAQAAGISSWVRFTGFLPQEDLFAELGRAHFLLLPSRDPGERLPNVVKEAMAMGAFPVVYPSAGLSELLGPEHDPFIVESPETMAEAVLTAWRQPNVRQALVQSGYERIERDFQIHQSARQLAALWGSLQPMDGGKH